MTIRADRTAAGQASRRSFLFLQGLATPFYQTLGEKLVAEGHTVRKVSFSCGDRVFWKGLPDIPFREHMEVLPEFYRDTLEKYHIDTIVLFGDCRPVHQPVRAVAEEMGAQVFVCEEGYLRPGWITFEQGGTNYNSSFPRDMTTILAEAATLTPPGTKGSAIPISLINRGWMDIRNHVAAFGDRSHFPHYQSHRPEPFLREVGGWARKILSAPFKKRHYRKIAARYEVPDTDFYLVPLQLNSDSQIRVHSEYASVVDFIAEVIGSFAAHAPSDTRLLIKQHPLDSCIIQHAKIVARLAQNAGVSERVDYLAGGDIDRILAACKGTVLVNSTVGFSALKAGCPVKVTGKAFYDIEGLTDQQPLDSFWRQPFMANPAHVDAYLTLLAAKTLLPGDLFTEKGIDIATTHAVRRLTGETTLSEASGS